MKKLLGGLLIIATALTFVPTVVSAQGRPCGERHELIETLMEKYREATVAVGITDAGGLVEVLSSGDGETWTIIVSKANGMSCLVAVGEAWRTMKFDEALSGPST